MPTVFKYVRDIDIPRDTGEPRFCKVVRMLQNVYETERELYKQQSYIWPARITW